MTTRTLTKKGLCKSNIFEARVTFEIIDIACINILTNSVEVVKIKKGTLCLRTSINVNVGVLQSRFVSY